MIKGKRVKGEKVKRYKSRKDKIIPIPIHRDGRRERVKKWKSEKVKKSVKCGPSMSHPFALIGLDLLQNYFPSLF